MVEVITEQNFDKVVMGADLPVLVDFYATWCGPCKQMAPVIEELSEDLEGKALFGKVNVDENINLAQRYKILQVPTFLFVKDGKVMSRETGGISKEELAEELRDRKSVV